MNNTERFMNLTKHFGEEKQYINGGEYRLREIDEETYDFEFSLADPCGSSILHPQIRLKVENGKLTPVQLFDTYETPVKFLRDDTPENKVELEKEFTDLLEKFEQAIK